MGKKPARATESRLGMVFGTLLALPAGGGTLVRVPLGGGRGVGAAATTAAPGKGAGEVGGTLATVGFSASGAPGVLRPPQPSDTRPVPVLADPQTAVSAGPGGSIALPVDALPVTARVARAPGRCPTLSP